MEKIISRAYNRFELYASKKIIRKLSTTYKLKDEIEYYTTLANLHPNQANSFAKIIDTNTVGAEFWVDLRFYEYPNLGAFLAQNNITLDWTRIFQNLRDILSEWSMITPVNNWSESEVRDAAYKMYINKTEQEHSILVNTEQDTLGALFIPDSISINHTTYKNFQVIWPDVKSYIENTLLNFTPTLIHGDFCFSNILHNPDNNIFTFIDPRGSFGKVGIYGDLRYDIAKLYHSVDGTYEALITDNFILKTIDIDSFELTIQNTLNVLDTFESVFFTQYDKKQIKILQGCIFISMCTRHYDNNERQRAMYLTGVRLLNEGMLL